MSAKKGFKLPLLPGLFFVIVILTLVFASLKIFRPEKKTIYAKAIVSQGLWWSQTGKPDIYFTKAIKKGDTQYSSLGGKNAEITSVRYYPSVDKNDPSANTYDIFLNLRLSADYNPRSHKYTFDRSALEVGAPINLETSTTQITGTIMQISETPFDENYVEKTVSITKQFAYPWEYDAIKVGDTYSDGEDNVFTVISKSQRPATIIRSDAYGNFNSSTLDSVRYITVVAKLKVLEKDGQLFFGENRLLNSGADFNLWTPNFTYKDFIVGEIR